LHCFRDDDVAILDETLQFNRCNAMRTP
jgi:hypothetical protein